jgi:hypothetical protein
VCVGECTPNYSLLKNRKYSYDQRIFHPGSSSKNLSILNPKKWFLSSRKYDPGCSSRIRIRDPDPDFFTHPGSRIPDSDPQHCIRPVLYPSSVLFANTRCLSVADGGAAGTPPYPGHEGGQGPESHAGAQHRGREQVIV